MHLREEFPCLNLLEFSRGTIAQNLVNLKNLNAYNIFHFPRTMSLCPAVGSVCGSFLWSWVKALASCGWVDTGG